MFIGEALVGKGDELAHIELVIGRKSGEVGKTFLEAFTNPKFGHTPLLAVIRPNLPAKPWTLILPKVTIKNMEQANLVFGSAQSAIAKAVVDCVEEGLIPMDKIDDWVVIISVFIHPKAKDQRKIYNYNYSATKLAIRRALSNYPPWEKIVYDKDRAVHPLIGYRVEKKLWKPPYIQVALDNPNLEKTLRVVEQLPRSDRIILEAGTPLLKKHGVGVIRRLREKAKEKFIIADLKTLDVGKVEADLAIEETADAVVASGLASNETLNDFIYEAKRMGVYVFVDMMYVENPVKRLKELKGTPDVVVLHRAIDVEKKQDLRWEWIRSLKKEFSGKKMLIAVAGGIRPETVPNALENGADILVVGRYITQSKDIERSAREFLLKIEEYMPTEEIDIDQFRVHTE